MAAALANLDRQDSDDSRLPEHFPSEISMPLSDLFDYSSDFWTHDSPIATTTSLEEELAVWDLLDMDADGDEDPEFDHIDVLASSAFTS